jgi:hypothetical protein
VVEPTPEKWESMGKYKASQTNQMNPDDAISGPKSKPYPKTMEKCVEQTVPKV